ncbi:acyl-CoA dehydrogenase family protein [Nocardioides immobilis]|nr:acyl-CoA dehydrogenase family protein [Nocardioides immobilis]
MHATTTEEHHQLALTARQVLETAARVDPVPPTWENRAAGLNRQLWRSLADLGLLGVGVPEERGGSGGGVRELCLLAEQVGFAVPRIPFVGTAAVLAVSRHDATDIVDGSVVVVPAWETLPTAVVPRARTSALRLNGGTVDGKLGAVAFGMDADRLLAFAGSVPVIVDLDAPGVRRTPVDSFDVTEPSAAIEFTGVAATVLEPVASLDRIRAVLAAELIGTGQRALDGAVEFAGQRHQFGRAIGSFQAIKHLLADRHVQLDAARLLVEWAAAALDDERPDATAAAQTALAAAVDAADCATRDALQVHGGIGFTWEHPSHVYLKRARARRSLLGSVAAQLDALADQVLAAH